MFWAIINTDNDVIARYDNEDEANKELAYHNEEHCVVEYFPYFHDVPSERIRDAMYWKSAGTTAGMRNMYYVLNSVGLSVDDL